MSVSIDCPQKQDRVSSNSKTPGAGIWELKWSLNFNLPANGFEAVGAVSAITLSQRKKAFAGLFERSACLQRVQECLAQVIGCLAQIILCLAQVLKCLRQKMGC
jgi:hypothetical protein